MYAQFPGGNGEGCALLADARRRTHKYGTEFEYHPEVSRREQHLILIIDFIRKFDQLNASEGGQDTDNLFHQDVPGKRVFFS
jgi:hypothetical protein